MSKTKPKHGASASAAAAYIFVSNVTFARLLNDGVIKRQPRDVGYNLDVVREARLRYLEKVAAGRGGEGADALTAERVKLIRIKRQRVSMMTRTKMHSTKKSDQPGFRIHPNGAVEMLTEREAMAIISRALREAMVEAGWQIRRLH